ncbi:MAG: SMP-30/gluconolactonase/LRE family protein [Acidobacteria bacterium]|nr:SMP-30/gluconolactonase/LRE family protein [Acidobacteriota bacterium]
MHALPAIVIDPPRTPDGQPNLQGRWREGQICKVHSLEEGCDPLDRLIVSDDYLSQVGPPDVIVEPADRKIPYQPWAIAKRMEHLKNLETPTKWDHLDRDDNCLVGFPRSTLGEVQIRQVPGSVVFRTSSVYRIIPMDGRPHLGNNITLFMGDSRGHWEGNTLVVDVTNTDDTPWFDNHGSFHSEAMHVVERWTLVDANTLYYEATVDDPKVFTRPWKMALTFERVEDDELWENACHEGDTTSESQLAAGRAAKAAGRSGIHLHETTAPDIPGVVARGTRVQLIQEGFHGTDCPIAIGNDGLLFCEPEANRINKIDNNDRILRYLDNTGRTVGLAYDHQGRLIGAQSREPRISVLAPTQSVLADTFEGQPLARPKDLVVDRNGGIYFTDPIPTAQEAFSPPPPGRKPLVFYVRPSGQIIKVAEFVDRPSGIRLSPDERTLYVTTRESIVAFDVRPDGSVRSRRIFVQSGGDGLAVDSAGRVYLASAAVSGVRVFSPQGRDLGTIPIPPGRGGPEGVAFAGPGRKTLYIVGGGAIYRLAMLAQGVESRAR